MHHSSAEFSESDLGRVASAATQARIKWGPSDQKKVMGLCDSIADAFDGASHRLALLECDGDSRGVSADREDRIFSASRRFFDSVRDLRTIGIVETDLPNQIQTRAFPLGTVAVLLPPYATVPLIATYTLSLVMTGNSVVFVAHGDVSEAQHLAVTVVRSVLEEASVPRDIVSISSGDPHDRVQTLLDCADIDRVIALPYSTCQSECDTCAKKLTILRPGVAPAYIESSAFIESAVRDLVSARSQDNGFSALVNHSIVIDRLSIVDVLTALVEEKAYILNRKEADQLEALFSKAQADGKSFAGNSAVEIAHAANIDVSPDAVVLVAPSNRVCKSDALLHYFPVPVLSLFVAEDTADAFQKCRELTAVTDALNAICLFTTNDNIIENVSHDSHYEVVLCNAPLEEALTGHVTRIEPVIPSGVSRNIETGCVQYQLPSSFIGSVQIVSRTKPSH